MYQAPSFAPPGRHIIVLRTRRLTPPRSQWSEPWMHEIVFKKRKIEKRKEQGKGATMCTTYAGCCSSNGNIHHVVLLVLALALVVGGGDLQTTTPSSYSQRMMLVMLPCIRSELLFVCVEWCNACTMSNSVGFMNKHYMARFEYSLCFHCCCNTHMFFTL